MHMGSMDLFDKMVDHFAAKSLLFFSVLGQMAYLAFVLYDKNTLAARKLSHMQLICTLVEELCSQDSVLTILSNQVFHSINFENCHSKSRRKKVSGNSTILGQLLNRKAWIIGTTAVTTLTALVVTKKTATRE